MLDREFSALMGGPNSIRDEDITVRLPAEVASSVEDTNLTLHVRLARLMARILTSELSPSFPSQSRALHQSFLTCVFSGVWG